MLSKTVLASLLARRYCQTFSTGLRLAPDLIRGPRIEPAPDPIPDWIRDVIRDPIRGRQGDQRDVFRDDQVLAAVPSGSVEE